LKAMILAAGRGERMRPLTDSLPKPLLRAGGKPLMVHTLEQLAYAGIFEVVINHAHLGAMIESELGNGASLGLTIQYSREAVALETAGGIANALSLLGSAPFIAVNGDIHTSYDYARLAQRELGPMIAHVVLVANPEHHPKGDFALAAGLVMNEGAPRHTFAGIGLYRPEMFGHIIRGAAAPLAPLLRDAADRGVLSGELHLDHWTDVGTPQRLAELDARLSGAA